MATMTALGSIPEWQDFSRGGPKPPYRFRDRASAPLMAGCGWIAEGQFLDWALQNATQPRLDDLSRRGAIAGLPSLCQVEQTRG